VEAFTGTPYALAGTDNALLFTALAEQSFYGRLGFCRPVLSLGGGLCRLSIYTSHWRSRFDEHATHGSPADALATLHFGAHNSTSMPTLKPSASWPPSLRSKKPLFGAPSDDKLAISSRYLVRLATAGYSSHLPTEPKSGYIYGFVNKEEEEHRDLGGAIDPKKPREEGKPWDLLALQPIFLTFCI
jgi:hypothetical protein